jgi:hypothetical protein
MISISLGALAAAQAAADALSEALTASERSGERIKPLLPRPANAALPRL